MLLVITHKDVFIFLYFILFLYFLLIGAFFLGSGVCVYHGIEMLLHPTGIDRLEIALGVLGISFVAEAATLSVAVRSVRESARELGVSSCVNNLFFLLKRIHILCFCGQKQPFHSRLVLITFLFAHCSD